jgi:hypothetical protein
MRTKTLSACATVSPAICTGFFIGRLTAMGSTLLIFTVLSLTKVWAAGARHDSRIEFLRQPGRADKQRTREIGVGQSKYVNAAAGSVAQDL